MVVHYQMPYSEPVLCLGESSLPGGVARDETTRVIIRCRDTDNDHMQSIDKLHVSPKYCIYKMIGKHHRGTYNKHTPYAHHTPTPHTTHYPHLCLGVHAPSCGLF